MKQGQPSDEIAYADPEIQQIHLRFQESPVEILEQNKQDFEKAETIFSDLQKIIDHENQVRELKRELMRKTTRTQCFIDMMLTESDKNQHLIQNLFDFIVKKLVQRVQKAKAEENLSNKSLIELQRYFRFVRSKYYKLGEVTEMVENGQVQDLDKTFYELVHYIIFSSSTGKQGTMDIFKHLEAEVDVENPIDDQMREALILLIKTNDNITQFEAAWNEEKIKKFLSNLRKALQNRVDDLKNKYLNKSIEIQELLEKSEKAITASKQLLTGIFKLRQNYKRYLQEVLHEAINQLKEVLHEEDLVRCVQQAYISQNFGNLILIKKIFSQSFVKVIEDFEEFQFLSKAITQLIQAEGEKMVSRKQTIITAVQNLNFNPKQNQTLQILRDSIVEGILNLHNNYFLNMEAIFQNEQNRKHLAIREYMLRGFSFIFKQNLQLKTGLAEVQIPIAYILGKQLKYLDNGQANIINYLINWSEVNRQFFDGYQEALISKILGRSLNYQSELDLVRSFCKVQQQFILYQNILEDLSMKTIQNRCPYRKFINQLEEEHKIKIELLLMNSSIWRHIEYDFDQKTRRPFCTDKIIEFFEKQNFKLQFSDLYSMVEVEFKAISTCTLKMQLAQFDMLQKLESIVLTTAEELAQVLKIPKSFIDFSIEQGLKIGVICESYCNKKQCQVYSINKKFYSRRKFYQFKPMFEVQTQKSALVFKPDNIILEAKIMKYLKGQKDKKVGFSELRDLFFNKEQNFHEILKTALEKLVNQEYIRRVKTDKFMYN